MTIAFNTLCYFGETRNDGEIPFGLCRNVIAKLQPLSKPLRKRMFRKWKGIQTHYWTDETWVSRWTIEYRIRKEMVKAVSERCENLIIHGDGK